MNHKHSIFDYKNFNNENLILRTPETRNNHIIIPVKYNQHQTPNQTPKKLNLRSLLFKTPKLYMPFKPNISNNKGGFVKLSFDNLKIDPNVKYFYDFICNIENYLKNEIINTNIVNFKNINDLNFKKTIMKADGFPEFFYLNFNFDDIKVFDANLNNIPIESVDGNFYAYFVIELGGFYYNKKHKQFKLIWNLVQFKLDKIKKIIDECLFLDEYETIQHTHSQNNSSNNNNHQPAPMSITVKVEPLKSNTILEKFFKMLSVGIPKPAIQHKMNLSGVDAKFLDYSPDTDVNTLPIELKRKIIPEQEKDLENDSNTVSQQALSLSSMIGKLDFNNLQLKKTTPNQHQHQKSKSQKQRELLERKGIKVPTLLEIQEARNKLFEKNKKENKNN